MLRLFILLAILCSFRGLVAGQGVFRIQNPHPGARYETILLEKGIFIGWDVGGLEDRHVEILKIGSEEGMRSGYRSSGNRFLREIVSDGKDCIFLATTNATGQPTDLIVTKLNAKLQPLWEFNSHSARLYVDDIAPDGRDGCFLTIATYESGRCILHLDTDGQLIQTLPLPDSPLKDATVDLEMAAGGPFTLVRSKSELTGVVNPCMADYDILGLLVDSSGLQDTVLFHDIDPIVQFWHTSILKSQDGGKVFLVDQPFPLDLQRSSIQRCDTSHLPFIDFRVAAPMSEGQYCSNVLHYQIPDHVNILILDRDSIHRKTKLEYSLLGTPQIFMSSESEDGLLWQKFDTDSLFFLHLDGTIRSKVTLPTPENGPWVATQIGYRPGGGYVVTLQNYRGQELTMVTLNSEGKVVNE